MLGSLFGFVEPSALGSLGYVVNTGQHGQYQDMAASQQAALEQGIMRGNVSPLSLAAKSPTPTISKEDYKDQKVKYSEFKKCENPIKQSELTYRG